jgi:hypothetical protein
LSNRASMRRPRAPRAQAASGKPLRAFTALAAASEIEARLGGLMRGEPMGESGSLRETGRIFFGSDSRGLRLLSPLAKTRRATTEKAGLAESELGLRLKGHGACRAGSGDGRIFWGGPPGEAQAGSGPKGGFFGGDNRAGEGRGARF